MSVSRPIRSMDDYRQLYQQSLADPAAFWAEEARILTWDRPFSRVLDADLDEVDFAWFADGRLNASVNCVDRHADTNPDKLAIRWVGNDPGERLDITYRQLRH